MFSVKNVFKAGVFVTTAQQRVTIFRTVATPLRESFQKKISLIAFDSRQNF